MDPSIRSYPFAKPQRSARPPSGWCRPPAEFLAWPGTACRSDARQLSTIFGGDLGKTMEPLDLNKRYLWSFVGTPAKIGICTVLALTNQKWDTMGIKQGYRGDQYHQQ